MQDRFKFRIFDKNQKKMVELDAVGYSSFDPFGKGINRLIMIPSGLNNTFSYNKQALYENDNFTEPMQCTGLKDKNGKLIYEADIVKYKDEVYSLCIGRIKWDNAHYELQYYTGEKYGWLSHILCFKHIKNMEVIGSIYENPELLEQL